MDSCRRYTDEELSAIEQEDEAAYRSAREGYERVLGDTIERARRGEDVSQAVALLQSNYIRTSQSAQRMMGQLRRADNDTRGKSAA